METGRVQSITVSNGRSDLATQCIVVNVTALVCELSPYNIVQCNRRYPLIYGDSSFHSYSSCTISCQCERAAAITILVKLVGMDAVSRSHCWPGYWSVACGGVRRLPKVTRRLIALYTVRPHTLTSNSTRVYEKKIDMENVSQDMAVSHSLPQERANPSSISALSPSTDSKDKGPVPMSFPSILRNSGLTSRYAHFVDPAQPHKKVLRRNDNEGKRWVRRRENGGSRF